MNDESSMEISDESSSPEIDDESLSPVKTRSKVNQFKRNTRSKGKK